MNEGLIPKSPINGALIGPAVSHPGVNAWAREKRYDEIRDTTQSWAQLNSERKSVTLTHRFFELLARKESQHAQPISVVGYQTSHR